MSALGRIMHALRGFTEAWQSYDLERMGLSLNDRYNERWAYYTGDAFTELMVNSKYRSNDDIYLGTQLIFKHVQSVVNFFANTVYMGDLSTDGQPLPDGSRGAIPIDPQIGKKELEKLLLTAISEWFSAWNWKQNMTLRPTYGAALGDVMTELVDDLPRRTVYPELVWPGRVKEIELNPVGDIKYYVLEYQVEPDPDEKDGESYKYRKEVDKDEFRYFKGDKPFAYFGPGTEVISNPYGFVPAIWDRHQIVWGERGMAATDSTWQALQRLNSLLTHGMDFQHKKFAAPVGVAGMGDTGGRTGATTGREWNPDDPRSVAQAKQRAAQETEWIKLPAGASFHQIEFDIGQTLAMVEFVKQGILEENPEATFFKQLRDMSMVTGPGAERLLGDAVASCKRARAGYDANTIKLFQMATSMAGYRINNGDWGKSLTKRQKAFQPFDLTSYAKGDMDFGISDRYVIPPTESERLQIIAQRENLQTQAAMELAGMEPSAALKMIQQKRENAEVAAF